jgi:predicted phage-related endonuclease
MNEIEWKAVKCGQVGASRISDIMAKTKSGLAASRKNYMAELVVARLTGVYPESYQSPAMKRGIEMEPIAKAAYEDKTWSSAVGDGKEFIKHPTIEGAGASPDCFIGEDGLLEIKNPDTAQHIETLLHDTIDRRYILQMQFQMAVTGRKWCDYVSFDNRMPEKLQLKIIRVPRNDKMIAEIEQEINIFLAELSLMEIELKNQLEAVNG